MSIPYQGSKRRFAARIYYAVANREKKGTLVDPFCGGLGITEEFLQRGWRCKASDADKYVVALAEAVISRNPDEVAEYEHPRFITRQEFEETMEHPNNCADWWVGYLGRLWTFGNNGQDYLFGHELTPPYTDETKKAGHRLVVDGATDETLPIPIQYQKKIAALSDWRRRRVALSRVVKKLEPVLKKIIKKEELKKYNEIKHAKRSDKEAHAFCDWLAQECHVTAKMVNDITGTRMGSHYCCKPTGQQPAIPTQEMAQKIKPLIKNPIPERWAWVFASERQRLERLQQLEQLERLERLQQLEQLEQLEQLQQLEQLEQLQQLPQLQRLEQLQQLQRLQQLEQLELSVRDYHDADILPGEVVYLDPPYKGTAGYTVGAVGEETPFDSDEFWRWAEEVAKTNPVYVSEYHAPEGWDCILTIPKRDFVKGSTPAPPEKLFRAGGSHKGG